jgi:hypothetical protein
MPNPAIAKGRCVMNDYWAYSVREILEILGPDRTRQEWVLGEDLPSIRMALNGTRFKMMEERELAMIVATARMTLRRPFANA